MTLPIPSPPVEVRRARSWAAQYLVDADKARGLLPAGLEPVRVAGRGVLILAVVRYEDTDLGDYNELAVSFLVRAPEFGVHIRHLPVTQEFTLRAGREIWGYPKTLAEIRIDVEPGRMTCTASAGGEHMLTMGLRTNGFVRLPDRPTPTFSVLDGELVRTAWEMHGSRPRMRPGGAWIELGPHPISEELRSLGLPKRAVATQTIDDMRATFGAPQRVTATV